MIIGVGSDIIDIRRVEKALARFGARFEQRVFTDTERAKAARRKGGERNSRASTYAKRFAAKEACAKALGTGFRHGVYLRDIGVVNSESGKPEIKLTGGAAQHLLSLLPQGMQPQIDLTMSDEYPQAQAIVIISALCE